MKTLPILALSILLTGLVETFAADESSVIPTGSTQADSAVVPKLRELITIREQQAQDYEVLAQAGRTSGPPSAAVALAEARIELARELGQTNVVLVQLRQIVEVRRDWVSHLKTRVADRASGTELLEARAALIQAEVQLLREQKQSKGK